LADGDRKLGTRNRAIYKLAAGSDVELKLQIGIVMFLGDADCKLY
jgi:hypothetical protein